MTEAEKLDAFNLIKAFLSSDEHYLDSRAGYGDGGEEAIHSALALFLSHPELGFVWMVYDTYEPVACCVVCYAISTSVGSLVVKLDDVLVIPGRESQGIGTMLINSLKSELLKHGVKRIDTSCHLANSRAHAFYLRHGFRPLNEQRLACLL